MYADPISKPSRQAMGWLVVGLIVLVAVVLVPLLWLGVIAGLLMVGVQRRRVGQRWGNTLIATGLGLAAMFTVLTIGVQSGEGTSAPAIVTPVPATPADR